MMIQKKNYHKGDNIHVSPSACVCVINQSFQGEERQTEFLSSSSMIIHFFKFLD